MSYEVAALIAYSAAVLMTILAAHAGLTDEW